MFELVTISTLLVQSLVSYINYNDYIEYKEQSKKKLERVKKMYEPIKHNEEVIIKLLKK